MDRARCRGRHALSTGELSPQPTRAPAHLITLGLAAVVLLGAQTEQWFFGDEWDFINLRALSGGALGLFAPHNEHWSTLPILEYRALYGLFGIRTYWPYIAVVVALHLVLTHLLWRTLLRIGVAPVTALGLAGVFAVLGAGAENLLWAFQSGFIGSVMFGYAAVLVLLRDAVPPARLVTAVGLLILSLMCSGIGITMTFFAAATLALRREWRRGLVVAAGPAVVFLGWYLIYARGSFGQGTAVRPNLSTVATGLPDYVFLGVSRALDGLVGLPGAGVVLALGMIGLVVRRPQWLAGPRSLAVAGALAALFFFALTGIGRVGLGEEQAGASRYVYIAIALLLPLIALCLEELTNRLPRPAIAVAGLSLLLAVNGIAQLYGTSRAEGGREAAARDAVLAGAALVREGGPVLGELPDPLFAPQLTVSDLRRMVREDNLPDSAVSTPGIVTAQARLLSDVRPGTEPAVGTRIVGYATSTPVRTENNCSSVVAAGGIPQVVLLFDGPGSTAQLTSRSGGVGQLFVVRDGVVSQAADFTLGANEPSVLRTLAPAGQWILSLPEAGATEVCSAAPPP